MIQRNTQGLNNNNNSNTTNNKNNSNPFHFNIYNILFDYYITLLYNIYFHTRRYFNHNPNVYLCEDRLTARSLVFEQFLPTADLIMLNSNSDQCK